MVIIFQTSCSQIPYEESGIIIDNLNKSITEKDINNKKFKIYLKENGYPEINIPFKKWGLSELIITQNYFNYELTVSKKNWLMMQTNKKIALLNPMTSIGVEVGRGDSNEELSKNIFGGGFNFTFETANKRLIRHEIAFNESQSALLEVDLKIWEARIKLISKVYDYLENKDLTKIIKNKLKLKQSILNMIQKRVELGVSSQIEYERVKIELNSTNKSLISLQFQKLKLRKDIASLVGLSVEKFNLIPINTSEIKSFLNNITINFLNKKQINDIKFAATKNSKKLRILLANYAIAESKLKYKIAEQYPDFNFSPAYTYDLGNYIWKIGIEGLISPKNKHKLLIKRAKQIRSIEAEKINSYQLTLINESESLVPDFTYSLEQLQHANKTMGTKLKLEQKLQHRFQKGIIDRLDLELELIKLTEININYNEALYNLIRKGLEAENIMQQPIFTKELGFNHEK